MLGSADHTFMGKMLDLAAPSLEEPVTYRRYTGKVAGNRAAGQADQPQYTDTPITAICAVVDEAAQAKLGGRELAGDVQFQIRRSQMPPAVDFDNTAATQAEHIDPDRPGLNDRVVWKGTQYKPLKATPGRLRDVLIWIVRCVRA